MGGHYEILAPLGEGSTGRVYKAHHLVTARFVAIKQPRVELVAEPAARDNFMRDVRSWARLIGLASHSNIVSVETIEIEDGIPLIVLNYVDGGTLDDWIKRGRLYEGGPERAMKRVRDVARHIAEGVAYAHVKIGVHQDLKPGNVLIQTKTFGRHAADPGAEPPSKIEPRAKVTDFALANAWENARRRAEAESGQPVMLSIAEMTPAYCSPEQMRREPVSEATDVWSWAVSVLEMFVGGVTWKPGFAPEALEELVENAHGGVRLKMPPAVADVLRRCLSRDPARRPTLDQASQDLLRG